MRQNHVGPTSNPSFENKSATITSQTPTDAKLPVALVSIVDMPAAYRITLNVAKTPMATATVTNTTTTVDKCMAPKAHKTDKPNEITVMATTTTTVMATTTTATKTTTENNTNTATTTTTHTTAYMYIQNTPAHQDTHTAKEADPDLEATAVTTSHH